jgi:threonine-phosphate decarboxylase
MNTTHIKEKKFINPNHGGQGHLFNQDSSKVKQWLDFSASINPIGPSPKIHKVMQNSIELIAKYPDPESTKFKHILSQHIHVNPNQLIITNGSTELIYLLPHLLKKEQKALVCTPIFSEYKKAFNIFGNTVRTLRYGVDNNFEPPLDKLFEVLNEDTQFGAVVLGHPNSPNGRLWSDDELSFITNLCESKNIYLIIDETFIDFCPTSSSALEKFANHPLIILVRSMTKFFALPGVRLGYGILHPKLVKKLTSHQYPWSVNGLAQELGLISIKDSSFIDKSQSYASQQRENLYNELKSMPAIKVFSSEANFILIQLKERLKHNSFQLYSYLLKEGIILRNCENFDGLDESYFRIGIRKNDENNLLISKLKNYFSKQNEN